MDITSSNYARLLLQIIESPKVTNETTALAEAKLIEFLNLKYEPAI